MVVCSPPHCLADWSMTPQGAKASDILVSKCCVQQNCVPAACLCSGVTYGLCIPPRFAPIASIGGQEVWFSPQFLPCGLSTSAFTEEPSNSSTNRHLTAILMACVSGTTPTAEVTSLETLGTGPWRDNHG